MNLILGEGVGLRMPQPSDRERWLELFHDPEQLRFGTPSFVPIPAHVDDLDDRIAEATTQVRRSTADDVRRGERGRPEHASWAPPAGPSTCPPPLQVADVGYSVHPDARGRGVASRSLRTLDPLADHRPRTVRGWHGSSSTTASRTPPPAAPPLAAGFAQEGVRTGVPAAAGPRRP